MTTPKKKQALGQSIGGVLFGFEQQIFRNQPPPHELVHHARPDDPVPAGAGGFVTIDLPDDTDPEPLLDFAVDLAVDAAAGPVATAVPAAAEPVAPATDPSSDPASDPEEG
jgi:hypothetical protein